MDGGLEFRVDRRVTRAHRAIETEKRRTRDEQTALQEFATIVRGLQVETVSATPAGVTTQMLGTNGSSSLNRVREAYRSTVMAVPHYEEDYDDTCEESLLEEFGPDVAMALLDGQQFDRRQKQALLIAIGDSIRKREELLSVLEAEQSSHAEHAPRVRSIAEEVSTLQEAAENAASFGDYDSIRGRLGVLTAKCEDLIADRQTALVEQREQLALPVDGPDVPSFVYTDLDCTYPLLDATAQIIDRMESLRREIEHEMTYVN